MLKILLTNDDGIHAPGLNQLYESLKDFAEVTVVAPLVERSTTGHTLSLDNPMRLVKLKKDFFGCSGFPADCTLLGIGHIFLQKNQRPDLVISGINRGANLGQDVYYSGTVAGAREAAFHEIPGIAISTASTSSEFDPENPKYATAGNFLKNILQKGFYRLLNPRSLININVPNLASTEIKGIQITNLGFRRYSEKIGERVDFRNNPYYWIVGHYEGHNLEAGSDTMAIENHQISITSLNLWHQKTDTSHDLTEFINSLN